MGSTDPRTDVRVYLVDDQDLFRAGLTMVLDAQPGMRVVGGAGSAVIALQDIPRARPTVVLMDIRMPGVDGIEATRRLLAACKSRGVPAPRVLMLTTLDTEDAAHRALAAGADGFMVKDAQPEFLVAAVRALAAGTHVIATGGELRVPTPPEAPPEFTRLTDRERDVFAAVAHGLSNREIAGTLSLGEATVKTHLTAVLQKLGLRDRVHVVIYAYQHGLAG